MGVYPQKQDGLFMQRIKIFGGRITWPQWRRIAQLASIYSPDSPLHITTRQDIELHYIKPENLAAIQYGLMEVALTTLGAGGDSVRNITICAGCGLCRDGFDLLPPAQLVCRHLDSQAAILNLPRKFKISFSGCQHACAKPWLNDLGFVAQPDGLFTAIGAGSLGPKPAPGIRLYNDFPAKDILPLCIAAIAFFEQCGDRENRHRARFRHIREKLGDEVFKTELDSRFGRQKIQQSWPDVQISPGNRNIKLIHRLQLPNGNISPKQAVELADAAEQKSSELRINLEHALELYSTESIELPEDLAAMSSNPIIIACPGSTSCPRGLVNCWTTGDIIRQNLAGQKHAAMRINISGCPNNCAQSVVADIGMVGMLRKQNGVTNECYRLYMGGGNGRNDKLAVQGEIVPAMDIAGVIRHLLK